MVETLDIFPTLCELTDVPGPDFVHGTSLKPLLQSPEADGHTAIAYAGKRKTIRNDRYRLIDHGNGFHELYDHSQGGETQNIADAHPEVVEELNGMLKTRLALP